MLPTMLTGADLLAKVKELADASKSELVRATGYLSTKKDGSERLNYTAFYEALLEAKGMNLGERSGKEHQRPGRKLSYATKVQFNGNLMVGRAYTAPCWSSDPAMSSRSSWAAARSALCPSAPAMTTTEARLQFATAWRSIQPVECWPCSSAVPAGSIRGSLLRPSPRAVVLAMALRGGSERCPVCRRGSAACRCGC